MNAFNCLPLELLTEIVEDCDPKSVANLSETCRLLYELIYNTPSHLLWRTLFLSAPFDDPCKCLKSSGEPIARNIHEFDWKGELQRRFRVQTILWMPSCCRGGKELTMVLSTLASMIQYTPPATPFADLEELSKNLAWLMVLESSGGYLSTFIDSLHNTRDQLSSENKQLLVQLHTFFGLTVEDRISTKRAVQARAFVYDDANYSAKNNWGPFFHDGNENVNWEHLQYIMYIM